MASRPGLLVSLAALGLAGAAGVGWILLAPAPVAPTPVGPVATPGATTGTADAGPGKPGSTGDAPKPPATGPEVIDDDRDPEGPEGGASTEDILAAAAKSDWRTVQELLMQGGSSDPRVTDALVKGLLDDQYRPMVAELAKFLKDPGATEKFLALAKGEGNEYVRATAIRAAAYAGGAGVLEAAQEILRTAKPHGLLAGEALKSLGILGTPDAGRALLELLKESAGKPASVQVIAALGLFKSGETLVAMGEMLQDATTPPAYRAAMAEALGRTGDASVVNDLLRAVRDQNDEALRNAGYQALARVGSAEAVTELLQVVQGADNGRRLEAVQALAGVSNRASGPLLEEALKSPLDPVLRPYVVTALGRCGGKAAVPFLSEMLRNPQEDPGVKNTVLRALGEIGDPSASPALLEFLERSAPTRENAPSRSPALDALAKTARPADLPRLEKLFEAAPKESPEWFRLQGLVMSLRNEGRVPVR